MITIRKSSFRGQANFGWLDSRHTFSFGQYYDPNHMGFSSLRVINEDKVSPGAGFGTHGHRDMEIITYVLEGALEHKDSIGTGSIIRPGEVQRMSAGTGILHSEFNHSNNSPVHFLQIWLLPQTKGLTPSYEQQQTHLSLTPGQLKLIASPEGGESTLKVHQDVNLYGAVLSKGDRIRHTFNNYRQGWLQVARGEVKLNETTLQAGDGAAIGDESDLELSATEDAEILLFDLA
ncbi:MAG: pirin family protein [Microcoleaceae cyanobacterium]